MMDKNLLRDLAKIKLLALDFDGVMTDGCVYLDQNGKETVRCSRRDGMGLGILKKNGVEVCVISTEKNPVVSARCQKLKISCTQGVKGDGGKADILKKFAKDRSLSMKEVVYVGDDVNDLEALKIAGIPVTVADGHPLLKKVCRHITSAKGGDHAVREICELILKAKKIQPKY